MADRGFTIHDGVALNYAQLLIPAFTKGKEQLGPSDIEKTRGIAHVRIHYYTILENALTLDLLTSRGPSTYD